MKKIFPDDPDLNKPIVKIHFRDNWENLYMARFRHYSIINFN